MNKTLINIYNVSLIISIIVLIQLYMKCSKCLIELGWIYKIILLIISGLLITFSLCYNNNIINEIILPLSLYLNIVILIYIVLKNGKKYNCKDLILVLGILYLLSIVLTHEIIFKNGKLVNPNKTWIYKYIIILSVYFFLIDDKILSKFSKVGNIILLLYPLIFPLDEYFIHRIYSLCLLVSIKWYININY